MTSSDSDKFIVQAAGKKSRPVTRQQILDMCAAGRMTPDATVAAVGSTLHKPILVFLGEAESSETQATPVFESAPPKRHLLSKVSVVLFLMLLLGNLYSTYRVHRLFTAGSKSMLQEIGQLKADVGRVAAQQEQPAAAQEEPLEQDPLAGRPPEEQAEIRKIVSAIDDYQQALQQLASEGAADSPAAQTADETIARLLGRLQTDFGIGGSSQSDAQISTRHSDQR